MCSKCRGLWSTVAKSVERTHVLQVPRMVLILAQIECDRVITGVLVTYGVQRHERYLYELQDAWD